MKKLLIVGASALAMVATPAFAQSTASANIQMTANVDAACGVGNHRSGATTGAGVVGPADFDLDDTTGQYRTAQTVNRSFGNVWCNSPATVAISTTQLSTTPSGAYDTSSFTNKFDVEVSGGAMVYVGGGTLATAGAATASKSLHLPGAFETGLGTYSSVDIKVLPALGSGGQPLRAIAGAYTGTVTITATAG